MKGPQDPTIKDTMATGTVDEVVRYFNLAVNAIDYSHYPITCETACRAYLQVLLIGTAMVPDVERHTSLGRSDLEVNVGDRRWVFEFKYAEQSHNVSDLLKQAVDQIQEHRYGETPHGKKLIRVALVFDARKRQFTAFQKV